MKAITLYQPWATLIAIGAKKIETRSWSTKYRGSLAIHAGIERKYIDMRSKYYVCDKSPFYSIIMDYYNAPDISFFYGFPFPRGAIIAVCDLIDCFKITGHREFNPSEQEMALGDFTLGRYAWKLINVRRLNKSIPVKGSMGLWEWDKKPHLQSL